VTRLFGNYDLTYHGLKAVLGGFEGIRSGGYSGNLESAQVVGLDSADSSRFIANLERHLGHRIADRILDEASDGPNYKGTINLDDYVFSA
jgi:hypothetical protein